MALPTGDFSRPQGRSQPPKLRNWILLSLAVDVPLGVALTSFLWVTMRLSLARLALPGAMLAYSFFTMQMLFYFARRTVQRPAAFANLAAFSIVTGFLMCDLTLGFSLIWLQIAPTFTVIDYGAPWLPITLVPIWFWVHGRAAQVARAECRGH